MINRIDTVFNPAGLFKILNYVSFFCYVIFARPDTRIRDAPEADCSEVFPNSRIAGRGGKDQTWQGDKLFRGWSIADHMCHPYVLKRIFHGPN